MILTYRNIESIVFPIYKLPSDNIMEIDGLVFLEDGILDDKNMPGKSLGMRRLQTPRKDELFKLKKGVNSIEGLLSYNYWIDSSGRIFIYKKTKSCDLKYYLIKKVERKETASVVWFYNLQIPFEIRRPPPRSAAYARILFFSGTPWLIYAFTETSGKDTKRMV